MPAPDARSVPTRVAVVVVTYDAAQHVGSCLDALAATAWGPLEWRVVVVDNGSTDGTLAIARDRPRVEVLAQQRNLGFAEGSNVGMRAALAWGADVVALVNDDAEVDPGWIAPLLDELTDATVGAVQPKLLVHGSHPPVVNSLGVWLDREGSGRDIGFGELDEASPVQPRSIELFTGGAVALRRELLDDVGLFDPLLFLYYEDVDLALRGARRGWRYRCAPASVVRHRVGASTAKAPARRAFYQERNRLLVVARHGSWATYARALWLAVRRVRFAPRRAHLAAVASGLLLAPRQLGLRWRDRRRARACAAS